jgi:two-component sensor histidine kinase
VAAECTPPPYSNISNANTRASPRSADFAFRWTERGGPQVSQPARFEFGHRLITEGLAYELDGDVVLEFAPTGVVCEMDIPIPAPPPTVTE